MSQSLTNPLFVLQGTTLPLAGTENLILLQGEAVTQARLDDVVLARVLTAFPQIMTALTGSATLSTLVNAIVSTPAVLTALITAIIAAGGAGSGGAIAN